MKNQNIRRLVTDQEMSMSFALRYEVFCKSMKRDQNKADHQQQRLFDDLDNRSIHIGSFDGDQLVGVLRITYGTARDLPENKLYQYTDFAEANETLSLVSKCCIREDYRKSGAFLKLCLAGCETFITDGIWKCFIATSDSLVPLFSRLGFRETGNRYDQYLDYGSSNPMVLDVEDTFYLKTCRSPLLRVVERVSANTNQPLAIPA